MQWIVISLVVLAICEPLLLDAKKVVLMMPRKVRRTHSYPWHQLAIYAKKNGNPSKTYPGPRYGHPQPVKFYRPKELPFSKNQYSWGSDDFDQGHEEVNHMMVPHGKGVTHPMSFGNGYIPFGMYKNPPMVSHHHNYEIAKPMDVSYGPAMNSPAVHAYSQPYLSHQASSFVANQAYNDPNDVHQLNQVNKHDRVAQNVPNGRSFHDFSNGQSIGTQFAGVQGAANGVQGVLIGPPGGIVGASSIPSPTIRDSRQGIVLRDSIVFDDYNRQVAALTKNWPGGLGIGNTIQGDVGGSHQPIKQLQLSRQYDRDGLTETTFGSGLDQNQKGYAVKETVVDTKPPDFRTMTIHSPVQPLPISIQQRPNQQILRQQPVQQLLRQQPVQQLLRQQPVQQLIRQQPVQHIPQQQSVQHLHQQQPVQHVFQQQPVQHIPQPQALVQQPFVQQQPVQHILQQQPNVQHQPAQQIIYQPPAQHSLQQLSPQSQLSVNYALPNFRGLAHG